MTRKRPERRTHVARSGPAASLEKAFHEPNRLAIVSYLCGTERGRSFGEIKERCALTDGNLNRHLAVLRDQGIISVVKDFVGEKPRTTVQLTEAGLRRFTDYLAVLESVLEAARKGMS